MYYDHPVLGKLYAEDVDWCVDNATVSFSDAPIHICLADGTEDGPSASAIAGFDWIAANWLEVQELIGKQAFAFFQPYADAVASVPRFEAPSDLTGTEQLVSLRIFARDDFSVTVRFEWQEEADPHEVTFYVERGVCESHSVDD